MTEAEFQMVKSVGFVAAMTVALGLQWLRPHAGPPATKKNSTGSPLENPGVRNRGLDPVPWTIRGVGLRPLQMLPD